MLNELQKSIEVERKHITFLEDTPVAATRGQREATLAVARSNLLVAQAIAGQTDLMEQIAYCCNNDHWDQREEN